jgi:hypothetical protein
MEYISHAVSVTSGLHKVEQAAISGKGLPKLYSQAFLFNKLMIPNQMLRCIPRYNARNWLPVRDTNLHT